MLGGETPLVILGLDAGDPGWIRRWAREGHLPAIRSVMERGCWGTTSGPDLASEHGVWVSLFSGLSRGQHGYYYFRQLEPGTYDLRSCTGMETGAPPFWARLRDRQKRIALIDPPDVPPVPGLNGVQVCNWTQHFGWITWDPGYAPAAEPPGLLDEVQRIYGPREILHEKYPLSVDENRRRYRKFVEQIQKKGRLCREVFSWDVYDLMVAAFSESHTAAHQFWDFNPEISGGSAAGPDDLKDSIREVYRAIDRELGLLLADLPERANVFLVSSVGLVDHYPTNGLLEAFCRDLGYQAAPEALPSSLHPMEMLRRLLPESWRVALGQYLPPQTRERLYVEAFRRGTDWGRTTAFPIPGLCTGYLRVNLQGREPMGIVKPGGEYEQVLDRLEADLKLLVDPASGGPAVEEVLRVNDAYGPDRHPALPDLYVKWVPRPYSMDRVLHPRAELRQSRHPFFRSSDHSQAGFVAAAGPAVRSCGDIGPVSVLDLAPTFLALLDEPIPGDLTGRPLDCIAPARPIRVDAMAGR
jgi:predicted AlkP superfamily phosphohydrolase/phosphomutase